MEQGNLVEEKFDIKESKYFKRLSLIFEESFVNSQNEFIALLKFYPSDKLTYMELLNERTKGTKSIFINAYFRLEDCKNDFDLKKKIISWLSRACCISQFSNKYDNYIHEYFRTRCNEALGVQFSSEDWKKIYCHLGNGIHEDLCSKFIESNFDLNILEG